MKRFANIQIALHWITLLLIILAYVCMDMKDYFRSVPALYRLLKPLHFNIGVLILLCMLARLALRHCYRTPDILPAPGEWQKKAALLMHALLYLCFIALPILGILTQVLKGASWSFLGVPVYSMELDDPYWGRLLKNTHETVATVGYFLIALHTCAALFHHYVQKDNTLTRMLPKCLSKDK